MEVTLAHEYYLTISTDVQPSMPEQSLPLRPFKQYYVLHKPTNTIQQ